MTTRRMVLLDGPDAPARFWAALEDGKKRLPPTKALGVNSRTPAELARFSHLFLSPDRNVMVGAHFGEMKALLNTGDKGAGADAIRQILSEAPIVRAFVYTKEKADYFARFGLQPVARYPWDGQILKPDWPDCIDRPDTYALAYDPKGLLAAHPIKDVANYAAAIAVINEQLSGHAAPTLADAPKDTVIVVGGGIIGLFIAKSLIERGYRVSLFEKGDAVPNPQSASGDRNRIFRSAYNNPGLTRMAQKSLTLWQALSAELGGEYYQHRGTLIASYAEGDRADRLKQSLDDDKQSYRFLDPAAAVAQFRFLNGARLRYAIHQPDEGGLLYPEVIGADLVRWLRENGAEIRTNVKIISHHAASEAGGVIVTTEDKERFVAKTLIYAVGAWSGEQIPGIAESLPIQAAQTSVAYLTPPADLLADLEAAPCMMIGGSDLPPISDETGPSPGYMLPPTKNGPGMKIGAAFVKRPSSDLDSDAGIVASDGQRLKNNVANVFANIEDYAITEVKSCPISFTPHEAFTCRTLDELSNGRPGHHADGLMVIADSGHAYKHAPIIGVYVADAVVTGDHERLKRQLAGDA